MAIKINGISADLLSKINGMTIASGAAPINLLLDDYPDASAAYSLRKLRSDYTGAAIRVRESGGDTEADIGFDVNGDLDTTALLSHCGANDGFVTTWYDQSGNNRNVRQAITVRQPTIVNAGSLIMSNGKPAVWNNKSFSPSQLITSANISIAAGAMLYTVCETDNVSAVNEAVLGFGNTNTDRIIITRQNNTTTNYLVGIVDTTANKQLVIATQKQVLISSKVITISPKDYEAYADGVISTTTASAALTIGLSRIALFGEGDALYRFTFSGKISEVILYNTQNTDFNPIQTEINTFYAIYPGVAVSGLLYDYPGASAAYSLRQLTIYDNGYKEKLIRVRRSSDGAETDVFADTNYELSLNSLTSDGSTTFGDWIGSDDGFVTIWYDQSAGTTINADETIASRQPRIVSGGVVIFDNGKPAMEAVDITTTLTTTPFSLSTTNAFFNVNSKSGSPFGSYHNILAFGTLQTYSQGTNYQLFQGTAYNTGLTFDAQAVISEISVSGTLEFFKNGVSGGTRSATFGLQTLQIMRYGQANQGLNGKMQELIVYDLDQTSNRAAIENNIINYYNIYP